MKKIPNLFVRDAEGRLTEEFNPLADWVVRGEGVPTRKWDGSACMIRDGKLYKRYDCKNGKKPPQNFEPCQDPDPITGHWPGWVQVGDGPEEKRHRSTECRWLIDGTYELCGPRINGNPERLLAPMLIRHGDPPLLKPMPMPVTPDALRQWLSGYDIEGVVWHHPDGRMVKLRKKDLGLERRP